MGVFENFPYTNFHDLNLDWILKAIVQQNKTISEFVTGNVLSYAEPIQWNITTQYAKNTVVIAEDGTAYMSIAPVPEGITLDNTDYWQPIFNFKSIITELENQIASNEGNKTNATKAYSKGALIWFADKLYRALVDIPIGTNFVVGVNVEKITVEQAILDQISTTLSRTAGTITDIATGFTTRTAENITDTATGTAARTAENITDTATGTAARTAENITDTATGTAARTAENIIENAEGDYTETVGHKTVEAEQITEHTTKDREIDVDGTNSLHVDGADTLNVGGAFTAAFADTFGMSAEKSALLKFKESLNIEATKSIFNSDVNIKKDIIYKTPAVLNDYFKTVEMADQNGNKYNVLVETENTGNITAASYDYADIRNYGGIGDGITDDTTAFYACMKENNLVYLPSGANLNWLLSSIILTSNQSVIGDGATSVSFKGAGDLFSLTGSNITIHGLRIDLTTAHGNAFHMLNEEGCEYIYISQIVTLGATHIWYDTDSKAIYTNLFMTDVSGRIMQGTAILTTKAYAFIILTDVTADNLPAHATWPSFSFTGVEGAHLTHCEAEGGGADGTNSYADGFAFSNCKAIWMDRCMADLCDGVGIRLDGAANQYFYLTNCVVSLCFSHGMIANGTYILLSGCFFNGRKGMSAYIANAHGIYSFASNITVSNCNITLQTGYPLAFNQGNLVNCGNSIMTYNALGIYLGAGVYGIVHDTLLINNDSNSVTDASSGTCKYYYIYNGSTMLTNT